MEVEVQAHVSEANIFIGCAAVADYRMAEIAPNKMKKTDDQDTLTLQMIKNPDIIAGVSARADRPFVVGFAAETGEVGGQSPHEGGPGERPHHRQAPARGLPRRSYNFV